MANRGMHRPQTRRGERGQTIVLVAISMFALIAMAALAIDLTALYIARGEAQQAADAAALAGAKAFVTSGYTSYPGGFGTTSWVCNGSNGLADYAAQAALANNSVVGGAPTMTTSCDFTHPENPTITVHVQRTGLPLFFAKIWGAVSPSVSTTATAEAYNPSNGVAPIQVSGVKPWLLPNCPPITGGPPNTTTCGTPRFINTNGTIANNGAFIGTTIQLVLPPHSDALSSPPQPALPAGPPTEYYFYPLAVAISPPAPACPASSMPSCSQVGSGPYFDNVACTNPFQFASTEQIGPNPPAIPIDSRLGGGIGSPSWGQLQSRTDQGTQCLIHATAANGPLGACTGGAFEQDCFTVQAPGNPILISPGTNNPDPTLLAAAYISRSDSVVTVPLFDGSNLCPLGPNNPCTATTNIVGFLQLGMTRDVGTGIIEAVILNASGTNTGSSPAVTGGAVASIPVRLVNAP